MRKTIKYTLEYFDTEARTKDLLIKIIPHVVVIKFNELAQVMNKVQAKWNRMNVCLEEKGMLIATRADDIITKLDAYDKEIEQLTEEIKATATDDFFEQRFELVQKVLIKNGYKDEFTSREFWEENVDTDVLVDFLTSVVYKDLNDGVKKKALVATSTTKG